MIFAVAMVVAAHPSTEPMSWETRLSTFRTEVVCACGWSSGKRFLMGNAYRRMELHLFGDVAEATELTL